MVVARNSAPPWTIGLAVIISDKSQLIVPEGSWLRVALVRSFLAFRLNQDERSPEKKGPPEEY